MIELFHGFKKKSLRIACVYVRENIELKVLENDWKTVRTFSYEKVLNVSHSYIYIYVQWIKVAVQHYFKIQYIVTQTVSKRS